MRTRRKNRRIRRSKNIYKRNKTKRVYPKQQRHTKRQNSRPSTTSNRALFELSNGNRGAVSNLRRYRKIKGGDRVVLLNDSERGILDFLFNDLSVPELIGLNSYIKPETQFDDTFLDIIQGKEDITTDNKMLLFRSYILHVYYIITNNANNSVNINDYLVLCSNILRRFDIYYSSYNLLDKGTLQFFKDYLSGILSNSSTSNSKVSKKKGINFKMLVYPDLSDAKMIGKTKEELTTNPERIVDYQYTIEGDDHQKNAEHALNVMFYSPYLLEDKGEDYVKFITKPITEQHGVWYNRT